MSPALVHNELLGHLVRADPWLDQGRSSYALAFDALDRADVVRAQDYGTITVQEAQEAYDLYALWLRQIPEVLSANGIDGESLRTAMSEATSAIGDPDLESGWTTYQRLVDSFGRACRDGDAPAARRLLRNARDTWQHHHDRACDTICALFDAAAGLLGEGFVGELWDVLLAGMYDRATAVYDPATMPWTRSVERLVLDIFEATRGHLTGPLRDGAFTVAEEEDRWVVTFAPCGSGGRTLGPDSRSVTTQRHDWAWNTEGVCLYCAHCCQLQQRAPIARLGFPLRVVNPPIQGVSEVCTWSIYKDPADVPDEAYTSVGYVPPVRRL